MSNHELRIGILGLLLCFQGIMPLYAQKEQALIAAGNKAYADGMYAEAKELYMKATSGGYEAASLCYNLGNACFKLNDFPGAILWYERASRLDPSNEDIIFNLNVANSKIADKIEPVPEMFYIRWYFSIVDLFPTDGWARITVALFILALGMGTLYVVMRPLFWRKFGFWAGITLLLLALISFQLAGSGHRKTTSLDEAIVFTPTVTVKSSPDEKSIDLFVLHEGTKVILLDRIGSWHEIRIANGSVGWLPGEAVVKI